MKKVSFYALRELHIPILMRVYQAFKSKLILSGELELFELSVSAPKFRAGSPGWPEEGLQKSTLKELASQGIRLIEISEQSPPRDHPFDCIITADACYDRVDGLGPVICVGHGTISKNIFFINQATCRRENYADVLCVPGPDYLNYFGDQVQTKLQATGFPKLDSLNEDHSETIRALLEELQWNNKPIALYAPTYNPELCSLEIMEEPLRQIADQGTGVFIKLHGATEVSLRDRYLALAAGHPNIHYLLDQDVIPWMIASDYLISDLSSVYVEYLNLAKPIYLYDHPQLKECQFYNPQAVEFKVRQAAYCFNQGHQLLSLIQSTLQNDSLKNLREQFKTALFPKADGQNSLRVATEIYQLCLNPSQYPNYRENYQYLILEPPGGFNQQHLEIISFNLSRLRFKQEVLACIISNSPNTQTIQQSLNELTRESITIRWISQNELEKHQSHFKGAVLLEGKYCFPTGLDQIHAMNSKFWAPATLIQSPILEDEEGSFYQRQSSVLPQRLDSDASRIQTYCKHVLIGHSSSVFASQWDGTLIKKEILMTFLKFLQKDQSEFNWFQFHQLLRENQIPSKCIHSLYGYTKDLSSAE